MGVYCLTVKVVWYKKGEVRLGSPLDKEKRPLFLLLLFIKNELLFLAKLLHTAREGTIGYNGSWYLPLSIWDLYQSRPCYRSRAV